MLDIKFIRNNPDKVKKGCQKKQVKVDIDRILKLDEEKRECQRRLENLRAEQNKLSQQPTTDVSKLKKAKELKLRIRDLEKKLEPIEKELDFILYQIPNLPLDDVPVGKDEKGNVAGKKWGEPVKFKFKAKSHLEIGRSLDLIDIKRAAKVSGTRFSYLKREAALLEFALFGLSLEVLTKEGFVPVVPPVMIKPEMAKGMGYPEQFNGEEAYYIEKDNLFLVGTAEQSLGPMRANEVLDEKELPKRYVAFPSTSFRREAGTYGKETRGVFRVHQFDKVEMFSFCKPEDSRKEHEFFLKMEEKLMQRLSIPYRIVQMCTGDLGFPTAAKYDIEAWLPSEGEYRETHSTSNCTDFQARRLNIRYRDKETNKLEFVHMVNGTAFAIGRILIAIIENYQQKDGSVKVPKVLQKYLDFKIIKR